MNIHFARTRAEILECFPALYELRPHLDQATFLAQVDRQMLNHGYTLLYVPGTDGRVAAVAGFRVAEYLAWGKILYLDDLVTREAARKQGYGHALLDWLIDHAQSQGCDQIHLDSGVQRHDAHRLYLSRKLQITSHHFAKKLP